MRAPLQRNFSVLALVATVVIAASGSRVMAQGLPLTMSKSFNPSTVAVGGTSTTTMTVTISNPNGFSVSGISFSDTYPAGLVPDQVGAYTCSAGSAVFNGSGFSLNNVTLGAGASCSVPMLMHATMTGQITNTTSQVTGTGVPPGGPASAALNALADIPAIGSGGLVTLAVLLALLGWFAIVRAS
jgi:hypothetical protein